MNKRLLTASFLGLLCLLAAPFWVSAQPTLTLSSKDASRLSTTTGLVDWWQVKTGPGIMISLFGYNNGAQQYIHVFDSTNGPTVSVTAFSAAADTMTAAGHALSIGQPIQLTATFAGLSAGIYYARPSDASTFTLYDTRAHAITATATTGLQDLTGSTTTATLNLIPMHVFVIAAADNYSCIVPTTGLSFSKGLVVAVSTSAALYTAGAKDVTMLVSTRSAL